MSNVVARILKQKCVYWPPAGTGAFDAFGQPLSGTAQELDCRWEEKAENYIDAQGTERVSTVKVFLASDVQPGGFIALGALSGMGKDPQPAAQGAIEIKAFSKTPDRRARVFLRIAFA